MNIKILLRKPLFGEKIGYVVICGQPGEMITDLGIDPHDFMATNQYTLNLEYYMEKQIITVLDRTLSPIGINVKVWYKLMPKKKGPLSIQSLQPKKGAIKQNIKRIDKFYRSAHCSVCRKLMSGILCEICLSTPQTTRFAIKSSVSLQEKKLLDINLVCRGCSGSFSDILCTSLDCPVYYSRVKLSHSIGAFYLNLKDLSW